MTADVKQLEEQATSLRRLAFVGVSVSTVATLVCVISVPMLYNYMQHMQSVMQSEVDFCKSRSSNIWREVTKTQVLARVNPSALANDREKRQSGYYSSYGRSSQNYPVSIPYSYRSLQ
eukprot:PDM64333.1 hypothetical protein PRIPAC_52589 [Pristionchus pacificus]